MLSLEKAGISVNCGEASLGFSHHPVFHALTSVFYLKLLRMSKIAILRAQPKSVCVGVHFAMVLRISLRDLLPRV